MMIIYGEDFGGTGFTAEELGQSGAVRGAWSAAEIA
jgi:hypothetical protein